MNDAQAAAGPIFLDVPLALWIALGIGILSPVFAFLGVWRSNANAKKNLFRQLEHDAEQRKLEREMTLRRDVYLPAAAALTHTMSLIGKAASLEFDQKALLEEFANDQAAIAKIHVVGSEASLAAVMAYIDVMGPALVELLSHRVSLMIRKNAMDVEHALAIKAQADVDRFIAMAQQHNLSLSKDQEKFGAIMKQFEFANSQFKQHSDERARLGAEQLTEQMAVSDRAIDLTGQLTRLLPNAIYAVRNELNLPLDLAFCGSLWDSQREKMGQTWQEAKARMHNLTEAVTANKK